MWFVDIPPHPNPPIKNVGGFASFRTRGEGVSLIPLLCKEGQRGGRGYDQEGALVLHRRLALPHPRFRGGMPSSASPYKGEEMTQEGTCRVVPPLQNSVNE